MIGKTYCDASYWPWWETVFRQSSDNPTLGLLIGLGLVGLGLAGLRILNSDDSAKAK